MKNNVLAIIVAAGTAVVGSSLFSVPAHALTATQDVGVQINVPEVLYLRTFQTVSLNITVDELAGVAPGTNLANARSGYDPTTSDGTTTIDHTSPFAGVTAGTISKSISQLYAVWSNNANGVTVNVTTPTTNLTSTNPGSTATATISNIADTGTDPNTAVGLDTPLVGGATFDVDLSTATEAGTYTGGIIRVTATGNP